MDREAVQKFFIEAYDEYADAIFRHCYFRISDRGRAQELMQDVFMKAWEYMNREGSSIHNMRAFLYTIAHHLIVNELLRRKKHLSLEVLAEEGWEPEDTTSREPGIAHDLRMLNKALEKLPADDRDIMVMRHIDELSVKQIARLVNLSENAVSVRLHRAFQKLKDGMNHST